MIRIALVAFSGVMLGPSPTTPSILIVMPEDTDPAGREIGAAISLVAEQLAIRAELSTEATATGSIAGVEQACRHRAELGDYDGVVWLELDDPHHRLYWFDRGADQFVVRDFASTGDSVELVRDQIVNVAASALADAFDPRGDATPATPSTAAIETNHGDAPTSGAPSDPPITPLNPRLWWSASYAGSTFADELPWQNGVGVSFEGTFARHATLGVSVDAMLPSRTSNDFVEVELLRFPIAILGGYRWSVGSDVAIELLGHIAIDPVIRTSNAIAPNAVSTPSELRWFSMVGLDVGVVYRPIARLRLFVRIGPEVVTSSARYSVLTPSGEDQVVEPDRFRVIVRAGLGFGTHPLGDGIASQAAPKARKPARRDEKH